MHYKCAIGASLAAILSTALAYGNALPHVAHNLSYYHEGPLDDFETLSVSTGSVYDNDTDPEGQDDRVSGLHARSAGLRVTWSSRCAVPWIERQVIEEIVRNTLHLENTVNVRRNRNTGVKFYWTSAEIMHGMDFDPSPNIFIRARRTNFPFVTSVWIIQVHGLWRTYLGDERQLFLATNPGNAGVKQISFRGGSESPCMSRSRSRSRSPLPAQDPVPPSSPPPPPSSPPSPPRSPPPPPRSPPSASNLVPPPPPLFSPAFSITVSPKRSPARCDDCMFSWKWRIKNCGSAACAQRRP